MRSFLNSEVVASPDYYLLDSVLVASPILAEYRVLSRCVVVDGVVPAVPTPAPTTPPHRIQKYVRRWTGMRVHAECALCCVIVNF